jgi:MFS transporter, DHA2 family, multidrug resistance protein
MSAPVPVPDSSSGLSQPTLPSPPTSIPWLGLFAVLMGTFISTLNGRLSSFGLADIRGTLGASVDEGAWITTAQTAAQMLITIPAVWMGAAYGPRRVLIGASIAFAIISLLTPYSATLPMFLTMQFLGGLASGCFIPLTLSFILLNMPPKYWAFGIAIYALNLELSLNISASLEGWYVEYHSWAWIFWQNVPLALLMSLCLHRGIASKPITTRPPSDIFGLVAGGTGLALIYAALDQGNRLDWLNTGLVWGLMLAGALLLAAILVHGARFPHPLLNLKVVFGAPLPSQFMLIAFLRLTITSTAFLIPLFLGSVRGFRALEVGDTLVWIAVPQLIFCPLAGLMLRRSDPRLVAAIGFIFISVACLMVANNLTPLW